MRKYPEFVRKHGNIYFKDYSLPDPGDELMIGAIHEVQAALYPNSDISDLPETITVDRKVLMRVQSMAGAYLHFVGHPAPTEMILRQLREVRRALRGLDIYEELNK